MSDESRRKTSLVLHSKTEIFSPPHKYLDGKQVFFTLPRGWVATDCLPDRKEMLRQYGSESAWIKHWNFGIEWEISRHGARFEFDLLLEGLGREARYRCWRPVDIKGNHGLSGYRGVPSFEDNVNDNYYFVLTIPVDISPKPRMELYCGVRYLKKHHAALFPLMNTLVRSCQIK